jgi:hypothetical protein
MTEENFNGYMPTPLELTVNGLVLDHKAEYQSKMMKKYNAPAMLNVFFINVAPAVTDKRVFADPNEAISALAAAGQVGKVYVNGEYMTIKAAAKLDLKAFSRKQPGRSPGRPMFMTESHAEKATEALNRKSAPETKAAKAAPNATPNKDRPLF